MGFKVLSFFVLAVISTKCAVGYNQVPEEFAEIAPKIRQVCQAESGANLDLIDNMMTGDFNVGKPEACYLKCLLDQLNVWSPDGLIDNEKLVNGFPEHLRPIVKPVFDSCLNIHGADQCEISLKAHKCYRDADSSVFFLM